MFLALVLPCLAFRAPVPPGQPEPVTLTAPDDTHLAFNGGLQLRLGTSARARRFQETWGETWVRWDERTATPRFMGLPGVPQPRADALTADIARLSGVDPAELRLAETRKRTTPSGTRTTLRYERYRRGVLVEHDQVLLVVTNGKIGAAWARLTPLGGMADALPGERIVPLPDGHAVLAFRGVAPGEVRYVDRLGTTVWSYDPRKFADLSVEYEPATVGDALVTGPARLVTMTDSSGATALTATDGSHALSGTLDAWLDGTTLAVYDNGAAIHVTGTDTFTITQTAVAPAAADVLHHFYVVQDWLRDGWPSHIWLDDRVPATVRIAGTCNAYYTSGTINFYGEGGPCVDLGRLADVVYHEVGHGIHEYILAGGTFAGDVSEGSADYIAATILDYPYIGNGAMGAGTYFRELETDRVYPTDVSGEVHNDGLIWGSFLWNLRGQWRATYGDTVGIPMVDEVFLGALEQGPTLTDLHEAVIAADDDDGDFTNGTPHDCELETLLALHGLGPGPIGEVGFDHTPLGPQASATIGYPLSFDFYAMTPDCAGLDEDSVTLWYTADDSLPVPGTLIPPTRPDTGDTATDTGADTARDTADTGAPPAPEIAGYDGWFQLTLTHSGVTFDGVLPRQPATSHVRYFMEGSSTDGTELLQTHGGDPAGVYDFWIGDRHAVWCEGFEAGFGEFTHGAGRPSAPDTSGMFTDQWETGSPTSGDWDPDSVPEGVSIAATVLNGDYLPNNAQYLSSPVLDLTTAGPMLLFHQSRWLTVEDALYDHAQLSVGPRVLYANQASSSGSAATLDVSWVEQDIDLRTELATPDADADLSALRFDWTLSTDQGLEYGGWALDNVCVYDLDDVPGHYRSENLVASDDAAVITVTWENPWMTPLAHTQLVRKQGGYPTEPADGEILLDNPAPGIGAAEVYTDSAVNPGETWYYALFAAPAGDEWQGGVIEGENADQGETPVVDTGDSDTPIDTGDSEVIVDDSGENETGSPTTDKGTGCGCAASSGATSRGTHGAALLGLGLALAIRRRRP